MKHKRSFFVVCSIGALLLGLLAWLPLTQFYWDTEVRRLCAIDGGAKVYETVPLPADQVDSRGLVKIIGSKVLVAPGYTLSFKKHYYKKGDVPAGSVSSMYQFRITLTRNTDAKLVGESKFYQRVGGGYLDLLAGMPSHFECPAILDADEYALARAVFRSSERKE